MFKKSFILFLSYSLFLSSVSPVMAKRKKKANRRSAFAKSARDSAFKTSTQNANKIETEDTENLPAPTPIPAIPVNNSGETLSVPATSNMDIKVDNEKIDMINAKTISLQGGQQEIMKRQGDMSKQIEAVNKQAVAATEAANLVLKNADDQKKKEFIKKTKEITSVITQLNNKIAEAQSMCSGISGELNTIYGLDVATTATSAIGTLTAGGATAVGFVKNTDKVVNSENGDKKQKAMGHARTGLMAASIATSGVSLGTSAAASVNAGKVAEKMKQCNTVVGEIRSINGKLKALIADYKEETGSDFTENKGVMIAANNIATNCQSFDIAGINTIKNSMTATAVISGIGTGTAIAGTATSAVANSKKMEGNDKQKKLDLTSNIMAGITAGTSLTSATVSGAVIGKVKAAIAVAKTCESAL